MNVPDDESVPETVLDAFRLRGATRSVLKTGAWNRHWLATGEGAATVLRRTHSSRSRGSVEWEQRLIAAALKRGWPAPAAVPSAEGTTAFEYEGHLWSLAPHLPGEPPSAASVPLRHVMGRLLAGLHRDLESAMEPGQRPGAGKVWELDLRVQPATDLTFNALLAEFARDHNDLAAAIRRHRYRNLRELARLYYQDLPDRPIHGDFAPWNLLFHEGRLSGVIDWDQSRQDALACDIAPLLLPFQPLEPALCRALFEGYEAVRPLSDLEWGLMPALVRASALSWISFLLVLWRLGEPVVANIARTATERLPAADVFDRLLPELRRDAAARA